MKIVIVFGCMLLSFILGTVAADWWISKKITPQLENEKKMVSYYNWLNYWLQYRQQGYSIAEYLKELGIQNVGIYGISYLGQRLYDELIEAGICVEYIVDNNPDAVFYDYKLLRMTDDFPDTDAIIVTPMWDFDEIEENLKKKVTYPVISLDLLLQNGRKMK